MILLDLSGVAVANFFAMKMQVEEGLIRHMILNSIRMHNLKYRDTYGQMVIACDAGHDWRRAIYPEYKAHRKTNREASTIDWNEFFRVLDLVRDEIKENLPYKVVAVTGCEADDVIATLVLKTQEFGQSEPVMIVSSDWDFVQLQKFDNVKQFSPQAKKLISVSNPVKLLQEKILRGDGGDGVPNILSPNDTFTNHLRQKSIYDKNIEEWIKNWDNLSTFLPEDQYKNFLRNQAMIDLERIPPEYGAKILTAFETAPTKSNILNYLIAKRCALLIECAGDFKTTP